KFTVDELTSIITPFRSIKVIEIGVLSNNNL
ncbi:unnamed protein product, partial [marine sediment metagenome]